MTHRRERERESPRYVERPVIVATPHTRSSARSAPKNDALYYDQRSRAPAAGATSGIRDPRPAAACFAPRHTRHTARAEKQAAWSIPRSPVPEVFTENERNKAAGEAPSWLPAPPAASSSFSLFERRSRSRPPGGARLLKQTAAAGASRVSLLPSGPPGSCVPQRRRASLGQAILYYN